MNVTAIVPAAGRGRRLKSRTPKAFLNIEGKPLVVRTLSNLRKSYPFRRMIVAADPAQTERLRVLLDRNGLKNVAIIRGGRTRAASVKNAVLAAQGSDWVLVHDAARPLVDAALVRDVLKAARRTGAALCVLPAVATVKRINVRSGLVRTTEHRESLVLAQTPQVFRRSLLLRRYRSMGKKAMKATDEAALFDGSPVKVATTLGRVTNIKITTPEDMKLLKFFLKDGA